MKSHVLASCFEMDPKELYKDTFEQRENNFEPWTIEEGKYEKDDRDKCLKFMNYYWPGNGSDEKTKYIPSPSFIRFVDGDRS